MYTILVVDDHRLEREGVKELLQDLNMDIKILEAKNGRDALAILKEIHVDILITDIKMPYINGIELSKEAKKINPEIMIMILSAYSEFDYAKEAIKMNVVNYVLKPIDPQEFYDAVIKTISECDFRKQRKKNIERLDNIYKENIQLEKEQILKRLLHIPFDWKIFDDVKKVGIYKEDAKYQIVSIYMSKNRLYFYSDELKNYIENTFTFEYIYTDMDNSKAAIIVKLSHALDEEYLKEQITVLKTVFDNIFKVQTLIVTSKVMYSLNEAYNEYSIMKAIQLNEMFDKETKIMSTESINIDRRTSSESIENLTSKIYQYIEARNYIKVKELVMVLLEKIKIQEGLSAIYIRYLCSELIKKIYETVGRSHTDECRQYILSILSINDMTTVEDTLLKIIDNIIKEHQEDGENKNDYLIEKVMQIINTDYAKDIGVEYLAQKVYLTPNYLGQLIKKNTGKMINQHILEKRMQVAREMLDTTMLKVRDVAAMVGYINVSYFVQQFKQFYGMTPTQYRENKK